LGVSLSYRTDEAIDESTLERLLVLVSEANGAYVWWTESLWISDERDEKGNAFGSSKLFRMIDDEDTDTYMVYLDICEMIRFLSSASRQLGIGWRCEIEAAPFGAITAGMPDGDLQNNLATFLDLFPGDFALLRAKSREEILAEWLE
jgi:hypothetical protein